MEHEQPNWLAYAEPEWGFGRVTVDGRRDELLFEFVRSDDGAVRDSVRLRSSRAGARACQRGALDPDPGTGAGAVSSSLDSEAAAEAGTGAAGGVAGAPAAFGSAARVQEAGSMQVEVGVGDFVTAQSRPAAGLQAGSDAKAGGDVLGLGHAVMGLDAVR